MLETVLDLNQEERDEINNATAKIMYSQYKESFLTEAQYAQLHIALNKVTANDLRYTTNRYNKECLDIFRAKAKIENSLKEKRDRWIKFEEYLLTGK